MKCTCREQGADGTTKHTEMSDVQIYYMFSNKIIRACTNHLRNYASSSAWGVLDPAKWHCMQCGSILVITAIPQGEGRVCRKCKILYTIHGTGVDGSLFIAGAETYRNRLEPKEHE